MAWDPVALIKGPKGDPYEPDDTGWQVLSLQNGWTAWNSNPLQVRKWGPVVVLMGVVDAPGSIGGFETIASLPSGTRPPQRIVGSAGVGGGTDPMRIDVRTGGNVRIAALGGSGGASAQAVAINLTWFTD